MVSYILWDVSGNEEIWCVNLSHFVVFVGRVSPSAVQFIRGNLSLGGPVHAMWKLSAAVFCWSSLCNNLPRKKNILSPAQIKADLRNSRPLRERRHMLARHHWSPCTLHRRFCIPLKIIRVHFSSLERKGGGKHVVQIYLWIHGTNPIEIAQIKILNSELQLCSARINQELYLQHYDVHR